MPERYEIGLNDAGDGPWRQCGNRSASLAMAASKAAREARPVMVRDTQSERVTRVSPEGDEMDVPSEPDDGPPPEPNPEGSE